MPDADLQPSLTPRSLLSRALAVEPCRWHCLMCMSAEFCQPRCLQHLHHLASERGAEQAIKHGMHPCGAILRCSFSMSLTIGHTAEFTQHPAEALARKLSQLLKSSCADTCHASGVVMLALTCESGVENNTAETALQGGSAVPDVPCGPESLQRHLQVPSPGTRGHCCWCTHH